MITINKAKEIAKYVSNFANSRFEDIDIFYRTTHRDRNYGIYQLKHGTILMDFLGSIHGNIGERLNSPNLLPNVFASPYPNDGILIAVTRIYYPKSGPHK